MNQYLILSIIVFLISGSYRIIRGQQAKKNLIGRVTTWKYLNYFMVILWFCFIGYIISNAEIFIETPLSAKNSIWTMGSFIFLMAGFFMFTKGLRLKNRFDIKLEYPSRTFFLKDKIKIGKVLKNINKPKCSFYLDIKDLTQHMFICGITGSGKSNFLQNFLINYTNLYDTPFLLTEFKGEYQYLQNRINDLLIIKPGENFSINIFDPEGSDSQVHAERVFQIFESGGLLEGIEYSPQMERVFVDILNEACKNEENRNWDAFFKISEKYILKNKQMSRYVNESILAIQNRIRRYCLGTLKNIFIKKMGLNVKELFDYRVLLDLSSIIRLGGEKEDALFFLNMILKYLWDKNITFGSKNYKGIRHITIIEDAQYFAPEQLSGRTKLTSYIEDIALLLRGTGECLISLATRPTISKEILANCGVLISFQNHMQKELMQEMLNLGEDQKEYLSMLKKGQCIVRVNSIQKPFLLQAPLIKRSWLNDEVIIENNERILREKLEENNKTQEIQNKNKSSIEQYGVEFDIVKDLNDKTFCIYCGAEIERGASPCSKCATKIEKEKKELDNLEVFLSKIAKKGLKSNY